MTQNLPIFLKYFYSTSHIFVKCCPRSRIRIVTMAGASIAIDDAAAADTVLSVKQRVFAANRKLFVRRQRLVYSAGPRGMDALADDETLGGAGVAQDGTAELDVLVADLTAAEAGELGEKVRSCFKSARGLLFFRSGFRFFHQFLHCRKPCFLRVRRLFWFLYLIWSVKSF